MIRPKNPSFRSVSALVFFVQAFSIFGAIQLLQSCSTKLDPKPSIEPDSLIEMILMEPRKGWLSNRISRTTYTYYLSRSEISQDVYQTVTGVLPANLKSMGANLPVTNVSYFDAILFCNAYSKQQGLDTVYSFKSFLKDSLGSTYSISGLQTNFSAEGYRLPTELEWEMAARGKSGYLFTESQDSSSSDVYSWYNLNSQGAVQEVCSKAANTDGFCDMAGNVMEWVQEFLEPIPDPLPVNYVGPDQSTEGKECPVKGGSFLSSINGLKLTNRKDTYGTYRSTRTEYLGFRIARGAISNPAYSQNVNTHLDALPEIVATRNNILQFFGTPFVRAIWRTTTGNLQWIDWSTDPVSIRSIIPSKPASHPSISPDGKWIAWGTRSEGQIGESSVFIQPLTYSSVISDSITGISAAIPRWWIDSTSRKTYLIYVTNPASNSDSNVWKKSSTYRQQISEGKLVGTPELLTDQGSFNGGLSEEGNILATGYTNFYTLDLKLQQKKILFQSPQNGKPPESSTQVCNVSMSPQGDPQILFLDFGSPISSTIIGKPYGIHEYLFSSNANGEINWWLKSPSGRDGWDHSEWSNQNQFAISTSFSADEARDQIHGIHIPRKETITLLAGVEFSQPHLWVLPTKATTGLNYDSLFEYNFPSSEYKDLFEAKTRLFWKMRSNLQIALVGSSRILHGIDPMEISEKISLNLGYSGAELHSSIRQIKEYILPHTPHLETIILSLDIDLLFQRPSWFELRIGDSPGYLYDAAHEFWREGIPPEFDEYLSFIPNQNDRITLQGLGLRQGRSWGNSDQFLLEKWKEDPLAWEASLDSLEGLLQIIQEKEIKVVGIIFPQNPAFHKYPAPFLYGPPDLETLEKINLRLENLQSHFPHFQIIDFHKKGLHDFGPDFADNEDHLNIWGAAKLTRQLDSILGFNR